ncbi:MAG TPA: hypothetical protein D7H88_01485, partial [Candidatus Poseidoniales archaeon]
MGSPKAEQNGGLRAVILTAVMLLALAPLSPASANSEGDLANLQAQNISAVFDNASETTLLTWENIATGGSELNGLFSATYMLYRHTAPISATNLASIDHFAEVDACDTGEAGGNPFNCQGGTHPGHTVTFPVEPGTNGSYYYAITTMLSNGTEAAELLFNGSQIYEPVLEITRSVFTPFIISVEFDAAESQTNLNWLNYNTINNILPSTGPDALQIRVWRTDYQITRELGSYLLAEETPIAVLNATDNSYAVDVPPSTQRSSYYSITYLLPNYTESGEDYEDIRFVGQNTMSEPVVEDNRPPDQPILLSAEFLPNADGTGTTTIAWGDVAGETGETYRVYRSDQPFSTILRNDVSLLVDGILEGINSYEVQVPQGFLGFSYYCVVTVDATGVINTDTTGDACTNGIEENAFYGWVAEPTNVHAEFIGDRTTRVTWSDQLGVEGEIYHIWHTTYRVSGGQFVENQTMMYLGTVGDGIGSFDVEVPNDEYRTNSFYFVTSEALYGNVNGTYHYTGLVQNFFQVPFEDTRAPNPPRIKNAYSVGSMNLVSLEWFNEDENNESYSIWRHYGEPFGEDENDVSTIESDGWEPVLGDIDATFTISDTLTREFTIPPSVDRNVWYAVTITDEFGNFNGEIFAGFGGNAFKVAEDTLLPEGELTVFDDEGLLYDSTTLVAGQYTLRVQVNEDLGTTPTIRMTTSDGGVLTGEDEPLSLLNDNRNNPNLGPLYTYDFSISSNSNAGDMAIYVVMEDESNNEVNQSWEHLSIDAQLPSIAIFSPTPSNDGSKYLYGNKINVLAGVEDDVVVTSFQYRFTYHFGGTTGVSLSTPWSDLTGITFLDENNRSLTADMEISAGNFETGIHRLSVRATDAAGNEVSQNVEFIVDYCRNRLDGTTVCSYEEALKPPVEPEVVTPSFSDPPYVVVWVIAVVNLLAIIVSLMIIQTSMSGPKKKKRGDDDEEDESWMAEFIGTSQDLDMDAVTGTGSPAPTEEKKEEETKTAVADDDEDDPFAINIVQRKERRRKKKAVPEIDDDDDDD